MKVLNLGDLCGPILLWGGAYSNLQAAKAVLDWADANDILETQRIFTGDAVAYCANPVETWDLVAARGGAMIAGNVEQQLAAGGDDCACGFEAGSACDVLSRAWFPTADAAIDDTRRKAMANLPDVITFNYSGKCIAVIHGGISDVSRFLFSTSGLSEFSQEIALIRELVGPVDIIVAGHSGIAFDRMIDGTRWINAGAVGMPPNDGKPGAEFVVLQSGKFNFHRIAYDHAAAAAAMRNIGLTQGYELTLASGWWPSEDVLPLDLRRDTSARKSA